jgi:dihydroorotase
LIYDLLFRGGDLVDPGARRLGRFDVAVVDGKVAAVERAIDPAEAGRVVDADGLLVVPGLVDLHTHVYDGSSYWGIDAAAWAPHCGTTTWVDAGSAGAYTLRGLQNLAAGADPVRIKAFVNLSSIGLAGPTWELANPGYLDENACLQAIESAPELAIGVKARIDCNTVGALGIEPLKAAVRVAEQSGMRLMVHIGQGPPELPEVVSLLREGDVLTHCATPGSMRLVGDDGTLTRGVREAVDRGVVLDVGHGGGSFSFRLAEALLEAGLPPQTISSDAHQLSVRRSMFDLPTCLSKYLALGLGIDEVIAAATAAPAALIGESGRLGTLAVGAVADVCLLAREAGAFPLIDVTGEKRQGAERLRAVRTFAAGIELVHGPLPPPAPWATSLP